MFNSQLQYMLDKLQKINLFYFIALIALAALGVNLYLIYSNFVSENINLQAIYSIIMICSAVIGLLLFIFIRKRFRFYAKISQLRQSSRLRKRIVIAFSLGAALPTILITIFSTYLFNLGVEAWFDQKISKVLDQSIQVGKSYVAEHELQLKETAISVADDLNMMYYELTHNLNLFDQVINAQAEMRSLDEAIVFQKTNNLIIARTKLSFSLSFFNLPLYLIERADKGEIVQISTDPHKIRSLIKLRDYHDTYLLIGRLVDTKILDHISQTNGTAAEYFRLKQHMSAMQVKFSMAFILLIIILLSIAIIHGRNFAEQIVSPIRELVIAAEKVKNADLSVQVPLKNLRRDEVRILSIAFNQMVKQLESQQKELIIAERALAWSDVARKVAHEIKNPLTPIQLSAEMILKKYQSQVQDRVTFEKYLRNILRHSRDIGNIVSEFVEFARLPAPSLTRCDIIALLNDLIESRTLVNNNIDYYFCSDKAKYELICDISQLNRVFINLLLNAEEAFSVAQKQKVIRISLQVVKNKLQIIFADNGTGFTKDLLKSAKEAYITTKNQGTGLGLSIVNRIIIDHNGSLIIANNPDGGAKIELIFDLDELKERFKKIANEENSSPKNN